MPDQYDFDPAFQRNLLAAFWEDGEWARGNAHLLRPESYTDELLAGVAQALVEHLGEHGQLPDLAACQERLKPLVLPGRTWAEYAAAAKGVWKRRGTNSDFYRRAALDFARRTAVARAVVESGALIQAGELDKIEAVIRRALQVGADGSNRAYDYLGQFGQRADLYALPPGEATAGRRVRSGLGPLDDASQGGLGGGEVACVFALAGRGKSTLLRTIGANATLAGWNVLHVSLENSREITSQMYDARLFGKPWEKIKSLPAPFREHMSKLAAALTSKLLISYFPTKTCTLTQLEGLIESCDPKPGLVIVDYAALLRAPQKREDRRFELIDIFEGLRSVTGRTQVRLWTAHQANRPGVGAKRLGMEHAAECFDVVGIIDLGVSVNSDEARPAECTLYILKNRLGKSDFEIPCSVDWATSTIKAFSDEVDDDSSAAGNHGDGAPQAGGGGVP